MDVEMQRKCKKTVKRNKYERNSSEMYEWWLQLFKMLESDFNLKDDERYSTLKEILPVELFYRLLPILEFKREQFHIHEPTIIEKDDEKKVYTKNTTIESVFDSAEAKKSTVISKFRKELGITSTKTNPYLEFFRRKPHRAAIWKELPPLKWEEMNLGQMAEAITEAIAIDYVEWLKTMGGDEETTLNVQSIKEMFEVGSQTNAATSIFVELKELASVPQKTAEALDVPDKSNINFLHAQIQNDRRASKKRPQIIAFGRRLPTYMQVKPPPKDLYTKWLQCEYIPPKLESMASVWQGITHLRSTRVFCEYLYKDRQEIKPPKYLVECGMMDPKNFGKRLTRTEELELEASVDGVKKKSIASRKSEVSRSSRKRSTLK
ncbi:uncharacterized protein [Diabrotica undecimpunctata]|uniref:uncharacterized protein n=1 Tax=Diabrotica undecimpunctata TaxID=50387 RepID=UPI003B632468